MTATAADALRMLAPSTPDDWPAGILAAADVRQARAEAATPGRWRYNPEKAWHRPGTAEYEEGVFAGPAGRSATTVAITGAADDPQSMHDAEHIAAEASPAHALAAVRHWRSVAERHVSGPIWSQGCQECRQVWPCDDMWEVADEARAYLGGSP